MLLSDLISHTQSVLPLFTDLFTTNKSVSAIVKSGDTVTVTSSDHTLKVGDNFSLSNVKTKVIITDITTVDGVATATCSTDHDLTYGTRGYTESVFITSPESAYTGTFTLTSVPSPTTFTFSVTGSPASSTGSILTFHNVGFNGIGTVVTVVDSNNFTFTLENDSLLEADGDNMLLMTRPRISGAAIPQRAVDSYTKKDECELWGFFVITDTTSSDDRQVDNDSKNERTQYEEIKLRMIQDLSFYVFIPSQGQISGRAAFDSAQALLRPIYKTLAGYLPTSIFTTAQQTILMPSGHQVEDYNGSYLIYRYDFQITEFIERTGESTDKTEFMANTGDLLPQLQTSSFRRIDWKLDNDNDKITKDDMYEVQN